MFRIMLEILSSLYILTFLFSDNCLNLIRMCETVNRILPTPGPSLIIKSFSVSFIKLVHFILRSLLHYIRNFILVFVRVRRYYLVCNENHMHAHTYSHNISFPQHNTNIQVPSFGLRTLAWKGRGCRVSAGRSTIYKYQAQVLVP